MADKVILPVEVAGLAEAKTAVEDIFRSTAVTAAQIQKQQEALSRQFKEGLREEKIPAGRFETTVKFPGIAEGEDVIMKLSADMGEDVREFLQKSRNAILRGAREGTPEATRQALQSMKMLSKDAAEAFNLGQITQPFVDRIENDIVSLEKQQRSDMRTTENTIRNDVKTFYDGRRRTINEAFKGAKGDISALQRVFDEQRQMVSELDTVTRAGVLNTNQRLQQARSEMRRTGEALRSATMGQMTRSERFAIMTPEERVLEMDRRRAVHQRALARRQGMRRDREQAISQATLGAAGVGIGLFGQAGFPLLNVGFAAMSSPMIGAMAAVSTAAGETARAFMRLRESAVQSAEQLGLLSTGFKEARAEFQALKAVQGAIAQIAEERLLRERSAALRNPVAGAITQFTNVFGSNLQTTFRNLAMPSTRSLSAMSGPSLLGRTFSDAINDMKEIPNALQDAIENMERHLFQFSARFETGEQMFQRISQAAASRGTNERRLLMQQLEVVKEQLEASKKMKEASEKLTTFADILGAFTGNPQASLVRQGLDLIFQ